MRSLLLVLILSATTYGCSKGEKESETTASSAKPASDEQRAADDKATEDLQARRAEEAKAAEAKAAADAEATAAHKATHEQLQANFDAADRRLNTLKEKVAKATGTKKKKATAAVATADTHGATMMAGIAKLREANLASWDTAKAQVESDAAAFNKSIDAVEATLQ